MEMRLGRGYTDFVDIRGAGAAVIHALREDADRRLVPLLVRLGLERRSAEDMVERWWLKMTEPQRHYHSPVHVLSMFDAAERVGLRLSEAQELAIWFHDAVYEPAAAPGENERKSAAWMARLLAEARGPKAVADAAAELIGWTARHVDPQVPASAAAILDLDLSGLAADPASFRRQSAAVRAECGHLTDEQYARSTAGFFRRLLERPRIYRTPEFAALEPLARRQVEAEVRRLEQGIEEARH